MYKNNKNILYSVYHNENNNKKMNKNIALFRKKNIEKLCPFDIAFPFTFLSSFLHIQHVTEDSS